MIDALVGGKLCKRPEERSSASGRTYVKTQIRAAQTDSEALFINVVAFSDSVKATLLALDDGDSASISGTLKIGTWEGRDGVKPSVSIIAERVLTAHHARKIRRRAQAIDDRCASTAEATGADDDSESFHDDDL